MNYCEVLKDNSFHSWKKYEPLDIQYIRFAEENPSIIAAGHKVSDVYYSYFSARASFINAYSNNFGDICANDKMSKLYTKAHFLTNALIEYAICLDISWQVVWAYIQPSSLEYLTQHKYIEMEKECCRESVRSQLQCIVCIGAYGVQTAIKLKEVIDSFDNDDDTIYLRSLYNKVKHQGKLYFEGIGANFTKLSFITVPNSITMLHRETHTVEEIEKLLIAYHFKLQEYMNKLIEIIFPSDYLDNTMNVADLHNRLVRINQRLK